MKFVCLVVALFCCQLSWSQTLPNFDAIPLSAGSDYKPAEPSVLASAIYVFSTPVNDQNTDRQKAIAFIIKWMSGTPDHDFDLDETASKIIKGSDAMLGQYMAAMTKYVLENPANAKEKQLVKDNAIGMLVQYCKKPENNLKMTKGLRKYSEEKN